MIKSAEHTNPEEDTFKDKPTIPETTKNRMTILLRLLLLLVPCCSAEVSQPRVVLAQIGNSVTLPRIPWKSQDKIHVNWRFNKEVLISRNPASPSSKIDAKDWQGRISLTSDLSLTISSVVASDFDYFKCEQYELGEENISEYKLYQVKMSTPPPLLAHDNLFLSCEIDQTSVRTTVRWLGPDKTVYPGTSSKNKHTVRVTNVSGIHSGKWTCEVTYENGILPAMTDVVIVDLAPYPPDPIYTSISTSNFLIPCSLSSKIPWSMVNATGVKGGSWSFIPFKSPEFSSTLLELHPNPSPAWKFPSGMESSLMEKDLKNHELGVYVHKVSVNNRGNYTCSLQFTSRTISRNVRVEVLQIISSPEKNIYAGNTLNLTCTLGHPMNSDLEVNWIPPHGSSLINLSIPELSIRRVSMRESGRWKCQLKKNATVLTTATISLKIEKAPVDIWLVVAVTGGVLVLILLAVIAVIIVRRRRQVVYRQRKRRFCCCKNPQPKGFYRT